MLKTFIRVRRFSNPDGYSQFISSYQQVKKTTEEHKSKINNIDNQLWLNQAKLDHIKRSFVDFYFKEYKPMMMQINKLLTAKNTPTTLSLQEDLLKDFSNEINNLKISLQEMEKQNKSIRDEMKLLLTAKPTEQLNEINNRLKEIEDSKNNMSNIFMYVGLS